MYDNVVTKGREAGTVAETGKRALFDLSGRTVLVTGASSGIGAHCARTLAQAGARVALGARRLDQLDRVRGEIAAHGGEAIAIRMDVTDEASTIAAYDAAEQAFGPVDTVIANAGMSVPGSALGLDMAGFDQMVAVNLRGVFLTVREGARRMVAAGSAERGDGRIVIVSSITAQQISPGMAVYSATKAGVTQMGRVLARDWAGKGINVNILAPGYIATDLTDGYFDTPSGLRLKARFARDRIMDLEALDPMLLYLSGTASAQTTGGVFAIDDGQSL
jgi:NAD(P)-dependent dehydrogenase (short-subunit alcohol dehydrogenase family)